MMLPPIFMCWIYKRNVSGFIGLAVGYLLVLRELNVVVDIFNYGDVDLHVVLSVCT